MFHPFPAGRRARACTAGVLCLLCAAVRAQSALPTVVVTGNPLGASDIAQPSSVLAGDGLVLRRGSTLGETLDGLPGVSSTWFGPNANRPVIRGQDGDRIRVLNNAGASVDASGLSYDHAVPVDPLVVERVEVLRGPAALLYGGSAVGGVVNAIDNRIPRSAVTRPTGSVELRGGGAAGERGAGALVEAGGGGFAVHADAFGRRTDDLRVPSYDRPVDGGGSERSRRVVNSGSRAEGGAFGGSMVWDHGYLGASLDTYRNRYGVVAEDDVTIGMQRDKFALAGEVRGLGGPLRALRARLQHTDYEHREIEGTGEVGTTFGSRGSELRVEAEHRAVPLAGTSLRGVFGVQVEGARASALGEEAFVPNARTRQAALFALEELAVGATRWIVGARVERTRIASDGDAPGATDPRFGAPQSRSFGTGSASLGAVHDLSAQWQFSGSLAYTERAPTYYELYANGLHIATAAFERSDAALAKEKGANVDLAVQWKEGSQRVKLGAWASRFSNYVALLRSGEPDVVDDGEAFPLYAYGGVPARLHGVELEGQWRVLHGAQALDLDGKLDWQRATNRASGEPLPRIAPLRVTLGATLAAGDWKARAEVVHAARQSRVPADDTATGSHTLVHLSASRGLRLGQSEALLFARLTNVGNTLAYNAATIASVRALSPLSGRALSAGLQVAF